jgi:hypothetical protein
MHTKCVGTEILADMRLQGPSRLCSVHAHGASFHGCRHQKSQIRNVMDKSDVHLNSRIQTHVLTLEVILENRLQRDQSHQSTRVSIQSRVLINIPRGELRRTLRKPVV